MLFSSIIVAFYRVDVNPHNRFVQFFLLFIIEKEKYLRYYYYIRDMS